MDLRKPKSHLPRSAAFWIFLSVLALFATGSYTMTTTAQGTYFFGDYTATSNKSTTTTGIYKPNTAATTNTKTYEPNTNKVTFTKPPTELQGGVTSSYCPAGSLTLASGYKISGVFKFATCLILQAILPVLFLVGLLVFVWGVVKFMMSQDSSEREQGKQFIIWGIVGLAVMFSVWGLVDLLGTTFNVNKTVPTVKDNLTPVQ